jgi:hypothetical protein
MAEVRNERYWYIYQNVKDKHPEWTVRKIHAVAGAIFRKTA